MNGTKVFEDSYCGVFAKQDEFLECLESIGRNSFWERKSPKICAWCQLQMTAGWQRNFGRSMQRKAWMKESSQIPS